MTDGRTVHVGIYADVDMNIIDGSAIWVQSLVQMLVGGGGVRVTLLCKAPVRRDLLLSPLHDVPGVDVVVPTTRSGRNLRPDDAIRELTRCDEADRFDVVILRGFDVSTAAVRTPRFRGRTWLYFVGLPDEPSGVTNDQLAAIDEMAAGSQYLLCQTEAVRSLLGHLVPGAADRLALLPMMVPPVGETSERWRGERPTGFRLAYAGKFAPLWAPLEMFDAVSRLRETLHDLELHVAGDKVHNPPDDPTFKPRVDSALRGTPGVIWHGAMSRPDAMGMVSTADLALSVRHPALSQSREISTKVLEYGAVGVPTVLTRGAVYEELLGSDYPLFIDEPAQLSELILWAPNRPAAIEEARERCTRASESYRFDSVRERILPLLERAAPRRAISVSSPPPRVLIATHDAKFIDGVHEHLSRAGVPVAVDHWGGHRKHDQARSRQLLEEADIVLCEWLLGNAVWYSHNLRAGQRLVARFHRMEMETPYPSRVRVASIDRLVVVAPWQIDHAVTEWGWPRDGIQCIPNAVDDVALDRPKLEGAEFNLGLLGYVPRLKRLDLALDLLESLRKLDDRYRLLVKGKDPWAFDWVRGRAEERDYFDAMLERLRTSELLRGAVSFEGFSHVADWFRKVGWILSMSDVEGSHVALGEGMAARAVPLAMPWHGVASLYPEDIVCEDVTAAVQRIQTVSAGKGWQQVGERARSTALREWAMNDVHARWAELLVGESERSADASC